jgi:hypothetical protein
MHSQNLIRLLLRQDLHETIAIQVCLCTRVGSEAEFADVVFDALSFQVLFCSADPGDFGVGVDDGGDGVVVDVAVTRLDVLDGGDT